jgi:phage shock protein C
MAAQGTRRNVKPMPTPDSTQRTRRIYRSRTDRILGGVAGGFARYLGVDPVLIRLALVALLFAGIGFVLYIIAWIIIPEEPLDREAPPPETRPSVDGQKARMVVGGLLVAIGTLLLADFVFDSLRVGRFVWPVAIIGLGVGLFAYGARK